jgi:hypothetical protein
MRLGEEYLVFALPMDGAPEDRVGGIYPPCTFTRRLGDEMPGLGVAGLGPPISG